MAYRLPPRHRTDSDDQIISRDDLLTKLLPGHAADQAGDLRIGQLIDGPQHEHCAHSQRRPASAG